MASEYRNHEMNPYNHNPFETAQRELKNEYDANRELAKNIADDVVDTMHKIFNPQTDEHGFWFQGE